MEWDKIIQHDVTQRFPLPDQCINVVITSPPYYGLRDYGIKSIFGGDPKCKHVFTEYHSKLAHENRQNLDGGTIGNDEFREKLHGLGNAKAGFCQKCGAWRGQLGLEPHPQMFVNHLVMICQEIKRVLKKSGSFYLNLGDTYYGSAQGYGASKKSKTGFQDVTEGFYASSKQKPPMLNKWPDKWLQPKQLMLIPSRLAIALQDDGWILRNDIIWHKPNPMPSSVKDRLNCSFEHVFHFVKSRKYYYDLDAIRETHATSTISRYNYPLMDIRSNAKGMKVSTGFHCDKNVDINPLGKNPGDVVEGGAILGESGAIKVPGGKGWTKKIPGGGAKCAKDPRWCSPGGKNPGDVLKTKASELKETMYGEDKVDRSRVRAGLDLPHNNHPLGKNPGDIISERVKQNLEHFTSKGSGGHYTYGGLDSPEGKHQYPDGKNPGDVIKHDKAVGRNGNVSYTDPLHTKPYHEGGKNPGDIYLSPKYNGTSGHSNRQGLNRPLDVVMIKAYKEYQEPIAKYLKQNIKKKHKPILDETFGKHKWRHWIRTDLSGASLPGVKDWFKLKEIIGFDDTFDNKIYEVQKLNIPIFQSGRNPGDFWEICTQPFTGYNPDLEHFAVFPEDLVLKPLKASCPKEICKKCGKPRIRITETKNPSKEYMKPDGLYEASHVQQTSNRQTVASLHRNASSDGQTKGVYYSGKTVGWTDCGCGVGFDSGVVLDPFCGRGTVGKVAKQLGLHYILFDAKPEYCELARLYIAGQKYKLIKYQQKLEGIET